MVRNRQGKGQIEALRTVSDQLYICGAAPLMVHRFASKAMYDIIAKQLGMARAGKEKREPQMDYVRALNIMPDHRFGFASRGIKSAMVRGAKLTQSMPMTEAKSAFFVRGEIVTSVLGATELTEIAGVPEMDISMVRIEGGTDMRFRPIFHQWAAKISLEYNSSAATIEQLAQMLHAAGFGVGLGEDRPQRGGNFGTFRLGTAEEYEQLDGRTKVVREAWFADHTELLQRAQAEDVRLYTLLLDPESIEAAAKQTKGNNATARALRTVTQDTAAH